MILVESIFNKNNISKINLSKFLKVSPQFMTKIFNGTKKLRPDHIEKLKSEKYITEEDAEALLIKYYLENSPEWFYKKIISKLQS